MKKNDENGAAARNWKWLLLDNWAESYPPVSDDERYQLKSSRAIAYDLREAGMLTEEDVTEFMFERGYEIVFEDGYPKWKVKMVVGNW